MIWLYAVLFILFGTRSITADYDCLEITLEGENILFPHETDCTKFYKCSWGNKVLSECPEYLHFNPKNNHCDLPEDAGCTHTIRKRQAEGVTKECPLENNAEDTLLPHEIDCGKFYKCDQGLKVIQNCPEGLHFNPQTGYCDWYLNAGCKTSYIPLNDDYKCPLEDSGDQILLPHSTDCTKFLHCTHGQFLEKSCPSKLYFNPDSKTCDWPWNVKCKKISSETFEEGCINSLVNVLLPHENDCSKFYRCGKGRKTEENCPRGLHFNVTQGDCHWPKGSFCSKTFDLSECSTEDGFLPHEYNCQQFYMCINRIRHLFTCPPGLYFNLESNNCEDPEDTPCYKV